MTLLSSSFSGLFLNSGLNVRLRYFIRVTVARNYNSCVKEQEFAVINYLNGATQAIASEAPAQGIKMEVGIEDCLHIEFEFDKQKYHLQVTPPSLSSFLLVWSLTSGLFRM